MLRPSYTELMDIVNQDAETDDMITSRYSVVIAAAKRARQIVDGASFYAPGISSDKAVSIAINEMQNGKLKIFPEGLEDGLDIAAYRRALIRANQSMALNADTVISPKDFADEFDADIDDDELFEDEPEDGVSQDYKYRGKAYAGGTEDDGYTEYNDSDDDYDYAEESNIEGMEIDGGSLNFK